MVELTGEHSIVSMIFFGMMFGVLHAFDADHVVSMASFVDQKSKTKHMLKYAAKWGFGHGGILFVLAAFLIFIGYQLPHWFVYYTEVFVGVVLIYLGIRLWRMVSKQAHDLKNQSHEHTPLFIGMLHGVAGSAPILALLPNMAESQFLLHIGLFSAGCLLGMFCFGLALALFQGQLKKLRREISNGFTRLLSLSTIGLGTFWLFN